MKLTSSIDDVVWLVPFLIIKNRRKVIIHVSIYMWVCLIQAILALAIAQGGVAALDAMTATKKGWSSDKILSVGAGGLLFAYGLWLLREWWLEEEDMVNANKAEDSYAAHVSTHMDTVKTIDDLKMQEFKTKAGGGLLTGVNAQEWM